MVVFEVWIPWNPTSFPSNWNCIVSFSKFQLMVPKVSSHLVHNTTSKSLRDNIWKSIRNEYPCSCKEIFTYMPLDIIGSPLIIITLNFITECNGNFYYSTTSWLMNWCELPVSNTTITWWPLITLTEHIVFWALPPYKALIEILGSITIASSFVMLSSNVSSSLLYPSNKNNRGHLWPTSNLASQLKHNLLALLSCSREFFNRKRFTLYCPFAAIWEEFELFPASTPWFLELEMSFLQEGLDMEFIYDFFSQSWLLELYLLYLVLIHVL